MPEITLETYLAMCQRITDYQRGYPLYALTNTSSRDFTTYTLDYSKGASYTCCDLGNNVQALKACWSRVYEESKNLFQARRILGVPVNFGIVREDNNKVSIKDF